MPAQPQLKKSKPRLVKMPTAAAAAVATLTELAAGKEASTKKFSKATVTTEKYEQQLKQGQVWLTELMTSEDQLEHPPSCPALEVFPNWSTNDLRCTFDRTPNCASPWVLALFIATKCFGEEERGKSMAWQIYSEFKPFWEQASVPLSSFFF